MEEVEEQRDRLGETLKGRQSDRSTQRGEETETVTNRGSD